METLNNYPLLIQVTGIVTLSAGMMIIITLTVLYVNRLRVKKREQDFQEAELIILDELNNHILKYNAITEIPSNELRTTVVRLNALQNKNIIFKQSLVKLLVYFKLNLTGAITRIISSTYSRLKLREFTLGKLKSKFWFVKTQGLTEVQEMRDNHSIPAVATLVQDQNEDVRVAAYSALLKLNSKTPFSFLSEEKDELSEWHQILLIDTITKAEGLELPEFKVYLGTDNKSILLLCIKLIIHYQQFDAVPKLLSMLDHEDEYIRNQVICALGMLNAETAEQRLINQYPLESNKNKSQILETLGKIASGFSVEFIKDKFLKAEHFSLLKSAAAAIVSHPIQLKEMILNSFTELDDEQKAVLKHYQEPLNLYGIH
ncbi:MAG: hypothetical protein EOO92_03815 [Pedobacter sp.]|nr:MAG: hypothetical protein EOO92_03815 [Pedobacter sp.]